MYLIGYQKPESRKSFHDYEQSGIAVSCESRRQENYGDDVYCRRLGIVVILVFHMWEARKHPVGYKQWDKFGCHEVHKPADRRELCDSIQWDIDNSLCPSKLTDLSLYG